MFTPVDFMSVTKAANHVSTPETAGSIASNTTSSGSIFTNTTETAGSIAYAGGSSAASSSGSSSFCAVA